MVCVSCGQKMSCKTGVYHYKESGLDDVFLGNIRTCTCDSCKDEIVYIPSMPELHQVIAEDLLQKTSRLNGKEIRFLRKNIGLKAIELQGYLGIDNATISRWENDRQRISAAHDRLLRIVYANIKGVPQSKIVSLVKDRFKQIEAITAPASLYIDINRVTTTCLLPA